MKPAAIGTGCFLVGLAFGAAAIVMTSDDEGASPPDVRDEEASLESPDEESGTSGQDVDRGGHVLVFLREDVSAGDRQRIEATIAADTGVQAYEYWNAEASVAEARRLFRDNPEMLEKIDDGVHIPESFRLQLRDPSRPSATVVVSHLEELPGVLQVTITTAVPGLGGPTEEPDPA